jgi:RNA polymerase sigma-70 factor, ECF subfamily
MTATARNYTTIDEVELVRWAKGGDREAFRAIMRRCNQRLFRVARAVVGSDHEAEDVLQEAYLRAYAALDSFRGQSALSTWLTTIVLNEARGRLRKRRRTVELDVMDQPESKVIPFPGMATELDPETEAMRAETRRVLEHAIDELPEAFRVAFMLHEVEGCSIEETAMQLGVKPETVKTRLFRARRLLRKNLEGSLSTELAGAFQFLGPRCDKLTEAVLARLR